MAYAEKADEEKEPQIALLFWAIAEAERVHATRQLNLVRDLLVKDTDTNLEKSFQREKSVSENTYPEFIKDAEDEGETVAALAFSHARDAESYHAKLYERAIYHVIKNVVKAYHACQFAISIFSIIYRAGLPMETAGWTMSIAAHDNDSSGIKMGNVCGLVLIF